MPTPSLSLCYFLSKSQKLVGQIVSQFHPCASVSYNINDIFCHDIIININIINGSSHPPRDFLVGWSHYTREEGGDLHLGVVRPVLSDPPSDCQFTIVGITSLTNGRYYNKLDLVTLNEKISVQACDYIAMTYAKDKARLPYVFTYCLLY